MRLQLILCLLLASLPVLAGPQEEIRELFSRYDSHMSGEKTNSQEIFTAEFLKENSDSLSVGKADKKTLVEYEIKLGRTNKQMAFVKRLVNGESEGSSFVVVKKNGKWLIEGTLSDEN